MKEKKIATDSREFAESIIDTVREPLIVLDKDLIVVSANRSFYEVFKVKPEQTLGQYIYDLGNKQWDIPKLRDLLETILPEKTSFDNYEVEHNFSVIGRRIMLLNARRIERVWGKERIILLAIEDVTERRRLEDLLNESEERYRRLFETASDGIVLLEKSEGHITHSNPAAVEMLGYSEEESHGKTLQDLGVPIDMSDFPGLMQDLRSSGIINYQDVPVTTKPGKDIFTDIYLVDRASLAQCNIRDISERKQAEENLRAEKSFIENALNTLNDFFFVFDLEGQFLRWNRTISAVTGYSDAEISTMKPTDFFKEDKKRISATIREAVAVGSASVKAMLVIKDRRQIPYEFRLSLLRGPAGNIIGLSGVGNDLTEHNKLEAQLRHAQKMEAINTLAGGIAHDFNNILNVILGYGGMVQETLTAGSPANEHMQTVLLAADKAVTLTRRLLVFSRKQPVEVKPLDLSTLILDLEKILDRILRKSIALQLCLTKTPLIVLADAGLIEQVLMNLVTNARDAMLEGGQLFITTSQEEMDEDYVAAYGYGIPGRYALISVSDTGPGIDLVMQKRIFEPFFTTKEPGKGTGLGLAISYGIIKQHNGYIKVYSEPGHGATFNVYLPLHEEAVPPPLSVVKDNPVMGGHETILVAEDDPDLRTLIRITLEAFGYKVILAQDGEEAIVKFLENKKQISLALLDVIMPKQNGKEVAKAIRNERPKIKVLFASGFTMNIFKSDEMTAAGFDFIQKPFQTKNLLLKIREILDRQPG